MSFWFSFAIDCVREGCPMVPCSVPTSIALSQVTLAVLGLSWDCLPSQQPCGRVSLHTGVTPAVPGLTWDYLPPQHTCGRVSWYTGVTPAVPGLIWDYLPSQQPCGRVSQNARVTLAVREFFWNYPPSTFVAESTGNIGIQHFSG